MNGIITILTDLAINMRNGIDEDWVKSVLYIEVQKGFSSYKGEYFKSAEGQGNSIRVSKFDYKIDTDLIKLHRLTQEESALMHKKWNRAIFTLLFDNSFEIEYIWDQEIQDQVDGYNNEII